MGNSCSSKNINSLENKIKEKEELIELHRKKLIDHLHNQIQIINNKLHKMENDTIQIISEKDNQINILKEELGKTNILLSDQLIEIDRLKDIEFR